jgi:hypothetical protein
MLRRSRVRVTVRLGPATRGVVALSIGFVAFFSVIGADSRWLGALGAAIIRDGRIPHGVPYAAAPSGSWPNVTALAELIFHGLLAAGPRGLLAAQLAAVAIALAVVARDARLAGAVDGAIAAVLLLAVVGAFPAFGVVRVQLFSLALFPVLFSLLRAEARRPGRTVWLVVPLLTLWSNLHGAVLVGLAMLLVYLVLDRARSAPLESLAVAVAAGLACCLTPAFQRTPHYFDGVLANEEARRAVGLWAPLSLRRPFDIVLALAGLTLLALAVRSRPRLWELAALLALAVLTVHAARSGVWLMLAAAPAAALGLGTVREASARVTRLAALAGAAIVAVALAHGPGSTGASTRLVERAIHAAGGTPILAQDVLAEQVALRGGTIEIGNPIDAFPQRDQAAYVDFLLGEPGGDADVARAQVVLVERHGSAEKRIARNPRFAAVARDAHAVLFIRRSKVAG